MHKTRKISSFELHDNTLLHETVDHNDTTKLQQLMPFVKNKVYNINYPDLDWNDQTPLHIACANGEYPRNLFYEKIYIFEYKLRPLNKNRFIYM